MLYEELSTLDYGYDEEGFSHYLESRGVNAPAQVIKDFYYGIRKDECIQEACGLLNLENIEWQLCSIKASELSLLNSIFDEFIVEIKTDVLKNGHNAWCLESRKMFNRAIFDHWENNKTWLIPPIAIEGCLINKKKRLLVEGHTRMGILRGFLVRNEVEPNSEHKIYIGHPK